MLFPKLHVFLLLWCGACSASTVTAIVCPKGIVIASDSGETKEVGGNTAAGRSDSAVKFVSVQNRLVVASVGVSEFSGKFQGRKYDYHFVQWMNSLQDSFAPDITPEALADRIATEAAATLDGFDEVIRSGSPKHNPREKFGLFIEYAILGYFAKEPQIYDVQFYIDWDNKKLLEPKVFLLHPNEETITSNYSFYAFGVIEALNGNMNPTSFAHRQLVSKCPSFVLLLARHNIGLSEIASVARSEVQIEEIINPTEVFGDIVSITIRPDGTLGTIERVSSEHKDLPDALKRKNGNKTQQKQAPR